MFGSSKAGGRASETEYGNPRRAFVSADTLRRLTAIAVFLGAVSALQFLIIQTPIELLQRGDSRSEAIVAYTLSEVDRPAGSAIQLSLYFDKRGTRDDLKFRFEKVTEGAGVDPVEAPDHLLLVKGRFESARFTVVPSVKPGTWKISIAGVRPFGLIHVTE